ncbi:MAG: nuclear transport factor 2 family protein [Acidobacteria bacterium]|nr:nuclear transport factor 2 family protein [Acidobacteriota bacterium]
MNKKLLLTTALPLAAVLAVVAFGYQSRTQKRDDKNIVSVRAVIEAQQAAWNRGDIEGFMDGYAREDETTFISGDQIRRGWQTVLERYHKTYDSRAKMGTLSFTELEFKPLSEFYIVATGRFQLTRDADTPHGRFTLIFRRTAKGWRIVHDHTSSAS